MRQETMGEQNFCDWVSEQIDEWYGIQVKIINVLERKGYLGIEALMMVGVANFADPMAAQALLDEVVKMPPSPKRTNQESANGCR